MRLLNAELGMRNAEFWMRKNKAKSIAQGKGERQKKLIKLKGLLS